jgi:hypothetical protein
MRRPSRPAVAACAALVSVAGLATSYLRSHDQLCTLPMSGATCSPPQDPWVAPAEVVALLAAVVCGIALVAWFLDWVIRTDPTRAPADTDPTPADTP